MPCSGSGSWSGHGPLQDDEAGVATTTSNLIAKILLEGRPGVGKTSLMRRLWAQLERRQVPLGGFITEEIRDAGRRLGFHIESVTGDKGILAHLDLPGPPRVGPYGVDLASFERIALPALTRPAARVILIDELGKMELTSAAFRTCVAAIFDSPSSVVATVHVYRHPFTDGLKARPGVQVVPVTLRNRDALPGELVGRLGLAP